MGLVVRMRAGLGVLAVLTSACTVLSGCSGSEDSAQPVTTPTAPWTTRPPTGEAQPATDAVGAVRASADPEPAPRAQAEPVSGWPGAAGWVEDDAWAAASRLTRSLWLPLPVAESLSAGQTHGTRVGAGPEDTAEAPWQFSVSALVVDMRDWADSARVYDMCDLEEAVAYETGDGDWWLEGRHVQSIQQYQGELDCDGDGVKAPPMYHYERGRYAYSGPAFGIDKELADRGFNTREGAEAFMERAVPLALQNHWYTYSHTLPADASPLGLNLCSGGNCRPRRYFGETEFHRNWRAIEYSRADAPVDEVRVLAESLSIRDGALRGLVRNWSRNLWAYRVTVTAGDRVWEWPLSMQPGEAAPFEFEDWTGDQDPLAVEYAVTGQMSPDVDRSRLFHIGEYPDLTRDRFHDHLPQEIIDSLPPGTEAMTHFYGYYVYAASHPSLLQDGEWTHEPPRFEPSVWSAWFDERGRVGDVDRSTPTRSDRFHPDGTVDHEPRIVEWLEPDPDGYLGFAIVGGGTYKWVGGANTAPALE